jgi:hypothetical protein
MAMDSYYTDRFDKYANDEGIYHVLFACQRGPVIKEKHRILGLPPQSENRLPCEVCVGEIKDWLASLPPTIRPSQFHNDVLARAKHASGEPDGAADGDADRGWTQHVDQVQVPLPGIDHDGPEQEAELRQEETAYQDQGEIVVPE